MLMKKVIIPKKHLAIITYLTLTILLVPVIAMQFTTEVYWQIGDFVVAGTLLFSSGYLYSLLTHRTTIFWKNITMGILVLLLLISTWIVLAVDII